MKRHLLIYRHFVIQYTKQLLEYRIDFIIGILSFLFIQMGGLLFLYLVFEYIPSINGWTFYELLLIYGVFQIPRGIDHLFTDNIWMIPRHIIRGNFDKYLLRPLNVLYHIVSERFQVEALGELLIGTGILLYVIPKLSISLALIDIIVLPWLLIIGTVIYTSIKLFTATFSFFVKNASSIMVAFYDMANFTKQPISIYPKLIRFLIVYALPFAFTSYYPAAYLLNREDPLQIIMQGTLSAGIFAFVSYRFWKYGLSKYESAGN